MDKIIESKLKSIREKRRLSRKELAEKCEISFRTIQDYEQGHKELSSAKAETLFKMSQALDCSMEYLLGIDHVKSSFDYTVKVKDEDVLVETQDRYELEKHKYRLILYLDKILEKHLEVFLKETIVSPEYKKVGRWTIKSGLCYLEYMYNDEQVRILFNYDFSETMLPWLKEVAGLKIDYDIRCRKYSEQEMIRGGDAWDES